MQACIGGVNKVSYTLEKCKELENKLVLDNNRYNKYMDDIYRKCNGIFTNNIHAIEARSRLNITIQDMGKEKNAFSDGRIWGFNSPETPRPERACPKNDDECGTECRKVINTLIPMNEENAQLINFISDMEKSGSKELHERFTCSASVDGKIKELYDIMLDTKEKVADMLMKEEKIRKSGHAFKETTIDVPAVFYSLFVDSGSSDSDYYKAAEKLVKETPSKAQSDIDKLASAQAVLKIYVPQLDEVLNEIKNQSSKSLEEKVLILAKSHWKNVIGIPSDNVVCTRSSMQARGARPLVRFYCKDSRGNCILTGVREAEPQATIITEKYTACS